MSVVGEMRLGLLAALLLAACAGPPPVSPTPSPKPSILITATPSPSPSTTAVTDVCHQGTVTYCVLNPDVTPATIRQTICVSGWTKTVRPPATFTDPLKRQQMAVEGLPGLPSGYEEDHRMPLELGGAPRDEHNLSPEAHPGSSTKDADEDALHRQVCAGTLALVAAQQALVAKWLGPYPTYKE